MVVGGKHECGSWASSRLDGGCFSAHCDFGRFWLLVKIEDRWKWTLVSRFLGAETLRVDACRAWQCSVALGAEIMVPAPSARRSSSGVFGM